MEMHINTVPNSAHKKRHTVNATYRIKAFPVLFFSFSFAPYRGIVHNPLHTQAKCKQKDAQIHPYMQAGKQAAFTQRNEGKAFSLN